MAGARLLGEQPRIGPERPELASPPLRVLVVRGFPYVLAYDAPMIGPVIILRVLHSSRDIPSLLRSDVR
jgi:toxin ParE1/3/4